MSRVILALLLAILFVAPAILAVTPATVTLVAQAVAPGATITIQPGDKKFLIDPDQDVIFTVTSSANAFGNNASLYYGVREAGTAVAPTNRYLWVTPYGVYLNNVSGQAILGPTVSIDPNKPPLVFLPSTEFTAGATLTSYELVVSDDDEFSTAAIAQFVVDDYVAGRGYPVIIDLDALTLKPSDQIDITTAGIVTFNGSLGDVISVYRPGNVVPLYVWFPAGTTNVKVYLDYIGSPVAASLPTDWSSGTVLLTLPNELPMGLHAIIAIGEYQKAGQTYYVTAATFIYVAPAASFTPFLISGAQGEQVTVRGVGFPMETAIENFAAFNEYVATATVNYYIYDAAGDVFTTSIKGSFQATFSLIGYITDNYPIPASTLDEGVATASGIMPSDLGALTVDFFYGIPSLVAAEAAGNLPPTTDADGNGFINVYDFRLLTTIFTSALVASRPDDLRFTATFGDEGLVVISVDGTPAYDPTIMGGVAYFTVVAGKSIVAAAVYNLPANAPFTAYLALTGEGNPRLPVYTGTTSSYGSAVFPVAVPMLPYGEYQLTVEVQTTPPLRAVQGLYQGTAEPVIAVLKVEPAVAAAEVIGTDIVWFYGGYWYYGPGNSVYATITGLEPFQVVTVSYKVYKDETLVTEITLDTFIADEWGVLDLEIPVIQYTPATYPVTGGLVTGYTIRVDFSATMRDGTAITGTIDRYAPVGPAVIQTITGTGDTVVRNGTVAGYDAWIVSATMPKVTPDTFTVTLENLVPGLPYVLEIGSYKEVIVAGEDGTATTEPITVTTANFQNYGVYVGKVYDAVFNSSATRLWDGQVFLAVASSTSPGTDPIGMVLFDLKTRQVSYTANVPANATGGVFMFAWNVDPTETLYVGITGIAQDGYMVGTYPIGATIYGIDTNGVLFIDVLDVNLGTPGDETILNKPAGTYSVYLKRTYNVSGATPLYGYMKVYPVIELVSGALPIPDGYYVAEAGATLTFELYGFTPSTYYQVFANTIADQPLVPLETQQIVGATTLTNESLGAVNVIATDINGWAEIQVTLPTYLQALSTYYIQITKAFQPAVEEIFGPVVILENKSSLINDAGIIGDNQWSQELKVLSAAASQVVEIKIYDFSDFIATNATAYVDGAAATIGVEAGGSITLTAAATYTIDVRSLAEYGKVVVKLTLPTDVYGATYTLKVDGQLVVKEEGGIYNAYIRFTMPSLPEEIIPAAEQFRVFGISYEFYANISSAWNNGTATDLIDINISTPEQPAAGFGVLLGAGTLIPVETILGSLSAIQQELQNAVGILVQVQDTVTMIYADLQDVKATVTDIRDNYLTLVLDNQSQILVKLDDLDQLIRDTGDGIKLEVQKVGDRIIATIDSAYMDLKAGQEQALQLLQALDARLANIEDGVAYIATAVGTIQVDVQDLMVLVADATDAILTKIDNEVLVEIRKNGELLGAIKADLETLAPVITQIADGVATLQTAIGELQMSVEDLKSLNMQIQGIVEENGQILVQIQTDLGTVKATTDAVQQLIEQQVVTGIENLMNDVAALGQKADEIAATVAAVEQQVAKLDDIQGTLTEVRSDVANVLGVVNGLEGTITGEADRVITSIGEQLDALKQDLQQTTQQAAEQAQNAGGTAQTWGIINAVLSLAVLAAAGYLILQIRQGSQ